MFKGVARVVVVVVEKGAGILEDKLSEVCEGSYVEAEVLQA